MLTISSRLFTWNPETGCFSGEASELEHELARQGWTRLDYRAGQWGFHMRSHRTGRSLWFQRRAEERDREGELTAVVFHANLGPGQPLILRVFND
jgi:hypothetical protein